MDMKLITPELKSYLIDSFEKLHKNNVNNWILKSEQETKLYNIAELICEDNKPETAHYDHIGLLKNCIALGFDINNEPTGLPIIFRAVKQRMDIAWFLLQNGAYNEKIKAHDQNYPTNDLTTVIIRMHKPDKYIKETIQCLNFSVEQNGFNPDLADRKNFLYKTKSPQIVTWLLDKGLHPLQYNEEDGQTPLEFHKRMGSMKVVEVMQEYLKKEAAQKEQVKIMKKINKKSSPLEINPPPKKNIL